jgi:5'-nucleotidase
MTEEGKAKLILITNDDGYEAEGVVVLYNRLRDLGETYLVAPDREKSATSLALTLREPLRARRVGPTVFAVEGTPADCL